MCDCLVEPVIVAETPLFAVSWLGATHSHLSMTELPRCWCGATCDDCKSHDAHSGHDDCRTPAGAYCLPHYDSTSPDALRHSSSSCLSSCACLLPWAMPLLGSQLSTTKCTRSASRACQCEMSCSSMPLQKCRDLAQLAAYAVNDDMEIIVKMPGEGIS